MPPHPALVEENDFLALLGALVDFTVGALLGLLVGLLVDFGPLVLVLSGFDRGREGRVGRECEDEDEKDGMYG